MSQPEENQLKTDRQVAAFAAKHVALRPDLQIGQEFPMDLWREMGKAGLFQIGLPEKYGGTGGGYLDLLQAGETFVQNGLNLGLGVSWIFQQIIARYVLETFGNHQQREKYLRTAACGKCTLSLAVSEPGRGASPKTLATKAIRKGGDYCLNGEKTYLTNGPIADVFIVVAVTDDAGPQKSFTAFIIPRDTLGLTVTPPMPLSFLKPSPHSGIQLINCIVDKSVILGREGSAWTDIVVPLGEIEDVVMTGPVLGGMNAQLDGVMAAIREAPLPDRALQDEAGALCALLQTLRLIAYEAARLLDRGGDSPAPLSIAFARLAAEFQADINRLSERDSITLANSCADLGRDMAALGTLQKRRMQIRREKIGAARLASPG